MVKKVRIIIKRDTAEILMNVYTTLKNSFKYRNQIHTLFDSEIFNRERK